MHPAYTGGIKVLIPRYTCRIITSFMRSFNVDGPCACAYPSKVNDVNRLMGLTNRNHAFTDLRQNMYQTVHVKLWFRETISDYN